MEDLTAIILTKNEESNIENCINSIKKLAKRVIVIDSFSTDKTVEKAKDLGADIYQHSFVNYATQFNWGLDNTNITTKWVLRIDADEQFTNELVAEIEEQIKKHSTDNVNGFVLRFKVFFMGKWIKYGTIYPLKVLRIFKYGTGRIEQREMDEHTILSHGRTIELKNDANHYDFKNINTWISKHNWYATRECQDYFKKNKLNTTKDLSNTHTKFKRVMKNKLYYKLPMFLRPSLYFCYRYFIRLGFLDGKEGLIFHFLQAYWYRFLVDTKIYEHKKMKEVI